MATGNKEIQDFNSIPIPLEGLLYVVKDNTDYKVQIGSPLGLASLGATGRVPTDQLGSGTASASTILFGNGTWGTIPAPTSLAWGGLTGSLSAQADLQTALNGKANVAHNHSGADITTGLVAPARLGTGTADTTTFLRGDGSWQVVTQGSSTATWGQINGTLTNQADLNTALNARPAINQSATFGNIVSNTGSIVSREASAGNNPHFWLRDHNGANKSVYYYNGASGNVDILRYGSGGAIEGHLALGAANATYNAALMWTSANDGTGSGLDADLLDGQQGSFYRSWGNITDKPAGFPPLAHQHGWGDILSPPVFTTRWPSWSEVSGRPSSFPPDPHNQHISTITGVSNAVYYNVSYSSNGDTIILREPNGVAVAVDFIATSDRNLKKAIEDRPARSRLADLLRFVSFLWKETDIAALGLIAQEVQQVAPEYVYEGQDGNLSIDKASLALECVIGLAERVRELESK